MVRVRNRYTFTCLKVDRDDLNKLFEECLSFISKRIFDDNIEGFIYCKKNYSQKYMKIIVPSISLTPQKDMTDIYIKYHSDDYSRQGHLNTKFKPPMTPPTTEQYVFECLIRDLNPLETQSIFKIIEYLVLFSVKNGNMLQGLFLEYGNATEYAERLKVMYHKKQLQIED